MKGYSYQEIGVITGLNESQVKVYLFTGREDTAENYLVSLEKCFCKSRKPATTQTMNIKPTYTFTNRFSCCNVDQ